MLSNKQTLLNRTRAMISFRIPEQKKIFNVKIIIG